MRVDFPTFGYPINPTSAKSFNSRLKRLCSPFWPSPAREGDGFVEEVNRAFPLPPLPPLATTHFCSSAVTSWMSAPVSTSLTVVPMGTLITKSAPLLPDRFLLPPGSPFSALRCRGKENSKRVDRCGSPSRRMSPPFPPSPPSAFPFGMNFPRPKLTQPLPPSPALTHIFASSTNFVVRVVPALNLLRGIDTDLFSVPSLALELHNPIYFRE